MCADAPFRASSPCPLLTARWAPAACAAAPALWYECLAAAKGSCEEQPRRLPSNPPPPHTHTHPPTPLMALQNFDNLSRSPYLSNYAAHERMTAVAYAHHFGLPITGGCGGQWQRRRQRQQTRSAAVHGNASGAEMPAFAAALLPPLAGVCAITGARLPRMVLRCRAAPLVPWLQCQGSWPLTSRLPYSTV